MFQEEWISEEELYTEGSSDEDDMALRMKRREQKGSKREKPAEKTTESCPRDQPNMERHSGETDKDNPVDENLDNYVISEQEHDDDIYMWRPTQGSFKLRNVLAVEDKHVTDTEEPVVADS